MRQRRFLATLVFVLSLITPCLAHHMAVVAGKDNTTENVTSAQLAKIFKGETKKWTDGRNVVLVIHESSSDELGTLARLLKTTTAEVRTMIADRKESIIRASSDAEVISAVASTPGAVGMVEEHSINDRVRVIKVDGKLPLEAGYLPH